MVFDTLAPEKYRAHGFYGALDREASTGYENLGKKSQPPVLNGWLSLWCCAEDLDQAVGNNLVFPILELPDSKAKAIRVAGTAITAPATVSSRGTAGRRVRIASTHAACTGTHATDSDRPCISKLLHNLRPRNLQLSRIDKPAVARRHIAK